MKKLIVSISALFLIAVTAFAQTTTTTDPKDPNRQIVEIRVQNTPAPAPVSPAVEATKEITSEVVKGAQDLGQALGVGLRSLAYEARDITFGKDKTLVQGIDELSQTDAGRFTMAVIAWKVAGKDALVLLDRFMGVLIGIPLEITLFGIWLFVIRRFFLLRTVKLKVTVNADKSKVVEYGIVNACNRMTKNSLPVINEIDSDDRFGGLIVVSVVFLVATAINLGVVIF